MPKTLPVINKKSAAVQTDILLLNYTYKETT